MLLWTKATDTFKEKEMNLKKRVTAIELQLKQNTCDHSIWSVEYAPEAVGVSSYTGICTRCGKQIRKVSRDPKMLAAWVLLRKEVLR